MAKCYKKFWEGAQPPPLAPQTSPRTIVRWTCPYPTPFSTSRLHSYFL